MADPVEILVGMAKAFNVPDLVYNAVLGDRRFPVWSASYKPCQHHYGKGGLAIHTLEVVQLCQQNNSFFPPEKQSDPRNLFLAALFHDSGKMWDYEPVDAEYKEWKGTTHKRRIHHISRSAALWTYASRHDFCPKDQDDVFHAILAHHGQRHWGSPVSPNTRLAWMLHLCDAISARMDDADMLDMALGGSN